jgi:hypothetical protein
VSLVDKCAQVSLQNTTHPPAATHLYRIRCIPVHVTQGSCRLVVDVLWLPYTNNLCKRPELRLVAVRLSLAADSINGDWPCLCVRQCAEYSRLEPCGAGAANRAAARPCQLRRTCRGMPVDMVRHVHPKTGGFAAVRRPQLAHGRAHFLPCTLLSAQRAEQGCLRYRGACRITRSSLGAVVLLGRLTLWLSSTSHMSAGQLR